MSRYKPYPQYKDSGVEWLGEVPKDWEARRLGFYFIERREKVSDKEYEALSVTKNGVVPQLQNAAKTDDGDNRKKVCIGDFVINSRSDRKGSSGLSEFLGSVSLINIVLQPNNIDEFFTHYLLKSYPFQEEFYRYGKGIVADLWSTNYSEMKNIIIPYPSLEEQQSIVNFLDNATCKIDTLIQKQQNLIELLKEKRQALISHAVTKGLNPHVKMKDSGVEWLGEVPAHWDTPKIKYIASTDSGGTPESSNKQEYYDNGIYPWVRTTDLNNAELFDTPIKITQKAIEETACNMIKEGSILIGMYGGSGTIGKHALLRFPSTINQAVCSITPNESVIPEYLHYFVQFYRPYWMIGAMGTRKDPNIGQDTVNNRNIIIPSLQEQQAIISYLDNKTSKIDILVSKAEKAIELLKERRTALISATVTGKIDVRGIAS